jgi:rubrerythrin
MRALVRLLLLGLLVAFLVHAVRRALSAGREQSARRLREGQGAGEVPERLVCASCGHEFAPRQTGWVCPECGK